MKKLVLASFTALALLGVAACSDSGSDTTTTQSTTPQIDENPAAPAAPDEMAPIVPPATDNSIMPAPAE
ncbi:hypothetical protein ACFPLB_16245 [Aquamicrobium segne]|uniref:Lipoprotein n=1 Tax=Aquamicrobium segne TaxID=469547 RepID=A0ABW0H2L3_9HYPH